MHSLLSGKTHIRNLMVFVTLLVILFTTPAISNTINSGTISGVVLESDEGQPLAGASIIVEGSRRGASTDLDGSFTLDHVYEGRVRLIVSHIGYTSDSRVVMVHAGREYNFEFNLQPSNFEMSPVVVTGTRTPRFVHDAPVRTEVVTSADLELRSAANLYEALQSSAGVRVEQQCQSCNFSMIRMNGLGGDHTQIMIDGFPVYSGLAAVYGLQQISSSEISRVEIVRGAGSALYGSNAIAGAINVISERPVEDRIEAGVEIGSFGTQQFDASAAMVRGNTSLHLTAQINDEEAIDVTRDGFSLDQVRGADGITDRVESSLRNVGASVYFSDVATAGDEIAVRFRSLTENRMGGELDQDLYRNPYSPGTEHITTNRYTGSVSYFFPLSNASEMDFRVASVYHERNATNDTYLNDYAETHGGDLPEVEAMRPYLAEERMYVVTANYNRVLSDHRMMLGTQYSYDELTETGRYVLVDQADPLYGQDYRSVADKHAHDIGVYVQDEWRISEAWETVLGLRYDVHRSEDAFASEDAAFAQVYEAATYDETSVNPRLALKWTPGGWWVYRFSLGSGFKVPYGFSEDLHLCSGSPRLWKGPSLKPETSRSVTVSADYSHSGFSLIANAYATRLENAIGIVNASEAASAKGYHYEYQNIDDALVFGVDLGAQLPLYRYWRLSPSISWFHGEYDEVRSDWVDTPYEDNSRYISRYPFLSGALRLDWSQGSWTGMLEARYTGKMYIDYAIDGNPANPGSKLHETEEFVLVNAQIGYEFLERYRVYVGARNLGDYVQREKHTDDAAFVYGPLYGRLMYGGVRIEL